MLRGGKKLKKDDTKSRHKTFFEVTNEKFFYSNNRQYIVRTRGRKPK